MSCDRVILFFLVLVIGLARVLVAASMKPTWRDCPIRKMRANTTLVKVVDCTDMGFKRVPRDWSDFKNAEYIDLGSNPYVCDCDMEWFRLVYDTSPSKLDLIADPNTIKCAEPASLKGKKVFLADSFCPETKKPVIKSWLQCKKNYFLDLLSCLELGMESVPKDLFSTPYPHIMLGENPYNCNCSMKWFVRKLRLKDFEQKILDDTLMTCAKPPILANRAIALLTENDVCPVPGICQVKKPCPATARCVNKETSFQCKDIDECLEGKHDCHKDALCKNKEKGYSCFCKPGFTGDGKVCTDINECVNVHKCLQHSKCINTNGSYDCACDEGFSKINQRCLDIDECLDKLAPCSKNARCQNLAGSYKCICNPEYVSHFNGRICAKADLRTCNSKLSPCHTVKETCISDAKNESYKCLCRPGFKRYSSSRECEDVDECKTKDTCSKNARCLNTFGSYECSCLKGYSKKGKRCVDTDECASNSHECHRDAVCINHVGGYKCRCNSGFQQLKDGGLCVREAKTSFHISDVLDPIVLVSLALLFFIVVVGIFVFVGRKTGRDKPDFSSDNENLLSHHVLNTQPLFLFYPDAADENILKHPNEAVVTHWFEEEDNEEFEDESE